MKRLLAVIAGGLGLRALWRRRTRSAPSPSASDLRAKLDEHRALDDHRALDEERALEADRVADEPERAPVDEVEAADSPSVEERRAGVHERARQALDELS
jgi:hypothetical protein